MKKQFLFQVVFTNFIFLCGLCFSNLLEAQTETRNCYHFNDYQRICGRGGPTLNYYSDDSTRTGIIFRDNQGRSYGRVYGDREGKTFGLVDGNDKWTLYMQKDAFTTLRITDNEIMRLQKNGNVGIGTTTPRNALDVCGFIRSKEVLVEGGWCDYVFEKDYKLPTLEEEQQHIVEKGHLIGFKSEEAMNGQIPLGDIAKRQQAKIEELVLHNIDMNDKLKVLKAENEEMRQQIATIITQMKFSSTSIINSQHTSIKRSQSSLMYLFLGFASIFFIIFMFKYSLNIVLKK